MSNQEPRRYVHEEFPVRQYTMLGDYGVLRPRNPDTNEPCAALFLFKVNGADIVQGHREMIRTYVIPFLIRAVDDVGKQMGKKLVGAVDIKLLGTASKTGTAEYNLALGKKRADNMTRELLLAFNEARAREPILHGLDARVTSSSAGSEHAQKDGSIRPGASRAEIEQKQFDERAVTFYFRWTVSDYTPQRVSSIYQIRELYLMKFERKKEPLDQAIDTIFAWKKKLLDNPFVKRIPQVKAVLDAIDSVKSAILQTLVGPLASVATQVVSILIPRSIDLAYEVKNSLNDHALYRFSGVEHNFGMGLMEVLAFLKGLRVIAVALAGHKVMKQIYDVIMQLTDQMLDSIKPLLVAMIGQAQADALISTIKDGRDDLRSEFTIATSGWTPFQFVKPADPPAIYELSGDAHRSRNSVGFTRIDLDFGGFFRDTGTYRAKAKIVLFSLITQPLIGTSDAKGQMLLLERNYQRDKDASGNK